MVGIFLWVYYPAATASRRGGDIATRRTYRTVRRYRANICLHCNSKNTGAITCNFRGHSWDYGQQEFASVFCGSIGVEISRLRSLAPASLLSEHSFLCAAGIMVKLGLLLSDFIQSANFPWTPQVWVKLRFIFFFLFSSFFQLSTAGLWHFLSRAFFSMHFCLLLSSSKVQTVVLMEIF